MSSSNRSQNQSHDFNHNTPSHDFFTTSSHLHTYFALSSRLIHTYYFFTPLRLQSLHYFKASQIFTTSRLQSLHYFKAPRSSQLQSSQLISQLPTTHLSSSQLSSTHLTTSQLSSTHLTTSRLSSTHHTLLLHHFLSHSYQLHNYVHTIMYFTTNLIYLYTTIHNQLHNNVDRIYDALTTWMWRSQQVVTLLLLVDRSILPLHLKE